MHCLCREDVYRRAKKINFSGLSLRDASWKKPGDVPLKIKFLLPNGKELKQYGRAWTKKGSMEGSLDISLSAITGSYTIGVHFQRHIAVIEEFLCREFVPDVSG